jgi:hypothetical protein
MSGTGPRLVAALVAAACAIVAVLVVVFLLSATFN